MLSGPGPGGPGTGWSWARHAEWKHSGDLGELSSWGNVETSLWLHSPEAQRRSWGSEMRGHLESLHRDTDWSTEGPAGTMRPPRGWEDVEGQPG